ncbi:sporulation protein YqfC [Desulfofundulus thermobenzoicus]|uniref:Sporulation protein YqfC n=1 Tax=Desulfofundulus thermobenzoicus TaxID=29376 RepID=A0A6N7IMN2_9FIRM|nr:sporulation protein YqfC [Desulfofundulus thermobenzoicus]HHW43429.1 sporulation protein YqfC [Desulfotomaculum sp.]
MAWREFKKRVKQQMSDLLEIPSDVVLDLPRIVLMGNLQAFIENHRGILEYTPEMVRIGIADGELEIAGDHLILRNILPDEICVEGIIRTVTFRP